MRYRSNPLALAAALLICLIPTFAHAQLAEYTQDFEALIQADTGALGADGWLYFGNVYAPDGVTYLYGYGPGPAPNDPLAPAFSNIALLEGGTEQGLQQLSIFSDYNNLDHAIGNVIESNVFQEQVIGAENVGETWVFQFDAKLGNLAAPSTAAAFIKTIEPGTFFLTNLFTVDTTAIPTTWDTYTIEITIDSGLVGSFLQFGFLNLASNYVSSGVFYDNVFLFKNTGTSAPNARDLALKQNLPNPFNPSTQIAFSLPEAGYVDVTVYDVAGRRVATLHQGNLGSGPHTVDWNGQTDEGAPVASGNYRYVLRTAQGQLARGMTLLK